MESSKTEILSPKGYCVVCNRLIFTIPRGKSKSYVPKICDNPECKSAHSKRTREETKLKRTSKKKDNINDPCKDPEKENVSAFDKPLKDHHKVRKALAEEAERISNSFFDAE
jgi:hypothetical protein